MQAYIKFSLVIMVLIGMVTISHADDKATTIQTRITAVHATAGYIGVRLNDESVRMDIGENAVILKGGKVIELKDLHHGDEVEVTYFKKGGFLGMGGRYVIKDIKVIEK